MWRPVPGTPTVIRIRTEEGAMDTPAFGPKLALAAAIASALHLGVAAAQSSLQVYSDNFGGPNQSAPAGATRDTVISMSVPRLHAVLARLRRVENILATHPIPPHDHSHTHPVRTITIIIHPPEGPPETVEATVDASGQLTVASKPGLSFNVDTVESGKLITVLGPNGRPVTFEVPVPPANPQTTGTGQNGENTANPDGDNGHNKFSLLYTDEFDPGFAPGVVNGAPTG